MQVQEARISLLMIRVASRSLDTAERILAQLLQFIVITQIKCIERINNSEEKEITQIEMIERRKRQEPNGKKTKKQKDRLRKKNARKGCARTNHRKIQLTFDIEVDCR
jgi:hypothetical protein